MEQCQIFTAQTALVHHLSSETRISYLYTWYVRGWLFASVNITDVCTCMLWGSWYKHSVIQYVRKYYFGKLTRIWNNLLTSCPWNLKKTWNRNIFDDYVTRYILCVYTTDLWNKKSNIIYYGQHVDKDEAILSIAGQPFHLKMWAYYWS